VRSNHGDIIAALFDRYELEIFGVSDASDVLEAEDEFREWLSLGYHGTMKYLENHLGKKYRPARLLPGCRCLVFTGLNYNQTRPSMPTGHGMVAKYAWGRDYHKVLGKRLKKIAAALRDAFPAERFLAFADATPLAERTFAARAGVGFPGRNTLLIRRGLGSYFVLGGIASTLEVDPGIAAPEPVAGGELGNATCPSGCTRCIDACPTGALLGPHRIDARACISYLTIEHAGTIQSDYREPMGSWLFGCDVCQDVCPFNKMVGETYVADFLSPKAGPSIAVEEILAIGGKRDFTARFAGSPLMRAGRSGLVRNACVAAANLGIADAKARLETLSRDPDGVISRHAEWALSKL
jgi:epoxyqueuosine reductase